MLTCLISREHTDFSESTEEIAPLTEEEKAARLAELRERVKAKKALSAVEDKEAAKRNEVWHPDASCPSPIVETVFELTLCIENPAKVHEGVTGAEGGATEEGTDQGSCS